MIENGLDRRKAFQPHDLFAVQFAIWFFELRMALVGNAAECMIKRHFDLRNLNL